MAIKKNRSKNSKQNKNLKNYFFKKKIIKIMKHMTEFQYGEIIAYSKQGLSIREIARLTCIPKSTIGNRIRKYRNRGEICRKRGSGRSNVLNYDDMYTGGKKKGPRIYFEILKSILNLN